MKKIKRSLLASALSFVLCLALLIGTTFAWFTDSVTNVGNRISAGEFEIDFLMDKSQDGNYTSIANGSGDIFGEKTVDYKDGRANGINWEPGKTEIVFLAIQNKGSLALKYDIIFKIIDCGLADALEYAIIDGATAQSAAQLSSWADIEALSGITIGRVEAGVKSTGQTVLDEIAYDSTAKNQTKYFALAVHMREDAGNEFISKSTSIDVTVAASQVPAESDSFSNQYDKDATFEQTPEVSALIFSENYPTIVTGISESFNGETLIIPEGVTGIAEKAFKGQRTIKTLSLPSTIFFIGKNAFLNMEDLENIEINGNVTVSKNELFFGAIDAAINSPNSVTYRFKGDVVVKKGTFDNNLPSSSNGIFIFDGGVEFQGDRWGSSFFKSKISKLIFNCEGKKININDSFMGQTEYVEIVFNGTPSSDSTISADAFKKGGNKDITIAVSDLNKWTNAGFPTIFEDGVNPDITVTEIA